MISVLSKYLIATLLTACLGIGGYAYVQHSENVKLILDVQSYKQAAEAVAGAVADAEDSCLVTIDSLNAHYKAQKELESLQESTGDKINSLPTLTIKETANEAPKNSQAVRYSDGDRLSPDLMRLLDDAYCYGDKDGCASPTK